MFMTASRPQSTAADPPRGSSPAWGGPALGLAKTASKRSSCGSRHHDDAVVVGIQPFARAHPDVFDLQHYIALALVALLGWQRHQRQCTDTDFGAGELGRIAH